MVYRRSGRAARDAGPRRSFGRLAGKRAAHNRGDRGYRAPGWKTSVRPLDRGDSGTARFRAFPRGIPTPEFVHEPGAGWRSRMLEERWQVNSGHREFRAVVDRPTLKLRYLAMLFAKEIVLRSHQDRRPGKTPLEQLVEVAGYADRNLSQKRAPRRRSKITQWLTRESGPGRSRRGGPSSSTSTVPRARPTVSRKAQPTTVTLPRSAITADT